MLSGFARDGVLSASGSYHTSSKALSPLDMCNANFWSYRKMPQSWNICGALLPSNEWRNISNDHYALQIGSEPSPWLSSECLDNRPSSLIKRI